MTDSFAFNDGFTCPLAKIKIATVVNRVETGEERSETVERNDEERRHLAEVSPRLLTGLGDLALTVFSVLGRVWYRRASCGSSSLQRR